jgi:hypothetical protein
VPENGDNRYIPLNSAGKQNPCPRENKLSFNFPLAIRPSNHSVRRELPPSG